MKFYEKPEVEIIDFNVKNSIMSDLGGVGEGPSIGEDVGDSPF